MVPDTLHAFVCGALLILSFVYWAERKQWWLLAALCVLNGVCAWVL